MISGEGISSESEGAADLLDSILGHGNALEEDSVAGTPKPKKAVQRQSAQKKPSAAAAATDEAAAPEGPPRGPQPLKLELKGLPLQVAPGSNAEERVLLQPHQKLMRLSIDGDPSADPVGKEHNSAVLSWDQNFRGPTYLEGLLLVFVLVPQSC